MKSTLLLFIAIFFTCTSSNKAQISNNEDRVNKYQLEFGSLESRKISVLANIYVEGDELRMVSRPQRFIPDINSWWDIIKVESIEDKKGNIVNITDISGNVAKLNREVKGKLKIVYTLNISYVDREYPNLNTAIGKSFDSGLFIVGKPLFIFGDSELKTIVQISKPKEVKITVPWLKMEKNTHSSENLRAFILCNVIISNNTIGVTDFSTGKLSYSLATFDLDKNSADLIKKIAKDVSNYYVSTFPIENDIRYVQLVYGVPGFRNGGEAYANSSASAISKKGIETSIFWKLTIYHELFHMWNPLMLNGVNELTNMEWFKEGFTDYITEFALHKTGHLNTIELSNLESNNLNSIKRAFNNNSEKTSIKNSGKNKGKNQTFVYNGGWLVAKWLDEKLKKETNKVWSMERLLQFFFNKYPPSGSNVLSFDAFIKDVSTIDKQVAKDLEMILNSDNWQNTNSVLLKNN